MAKKYGPPKVIHRLADGKIVDSIIGIKMSPDIEEKFCRLYAQMKLNEVEYKTKAV